jgi:predicted RNA-binding protein with PIN domain
MTWENNMPYLIDGHNLIPKIPGLSLRDLDDEIKLIQVLQGFASQQHTRIEVYFDQAPASQARSQSYGAVKAHFIHQDSTADKAMINRLSRMGKDAKNWIIVTSDREILVEARSAHSQTLSSTEFAAMLKKSISATTNDIDKQADPEISSGEVDFWMDQFGNRE